MSRNPNPNSYFTHLCLIKTNGNCNAPYGNYCETGYCYQCRCIEPPKEDPTIERHFIPGKSKQNCVAKLSQKIGKKFLQTLFTQVSLI